MSRALVLNASYEPLCVVPARRALILVLSDKAELVHTTDRMYHAERIAVPEPSVVRLCYYVKVPYQARVALIGSRGGEEGAPAGVADHDPAAFSAG